MKKLFTLFLTVVLSLSAVLVTGCNNQKSDTNTVTLAYTYGGYGHDYWDALAKDFNETYGEEITLVVEPIYDVNARPRIQGGTPDGDIVAVSQDMFRNATVLEELTDVYNLKALGEDKTIKEKVGDEIYNYYYEASFDGIYQFPTGGKYGYNWLYNKSVLDEAFGVDGYELPKTTNEFLAFGDTLINEKEIFLTTAALKETADDYLVYAFQNWFAQMVGAEGYDKFYSGMRLDPSSNEWVLSEGQPYVLSDNKQAIISTYKVAHGICYKGNDRLHPSSGSLKLMDNNQVFSGGGFGFNEAKCAFLYSGAWYENEIRDLLKDGLIEEQVYGAMRMPVMSDIVMLLEYRGQNGAYMTDNMLSDIVEAVDNGETSYEGVSEKDFNRIKEARNMVLEQICAELVIPKIRAEDEGKREKIYKVIQYLASDKAQAVATKASKGIAMFTFGYEPDLNNLGITPTKLIKDLTEIRKTSVIIDHACVNKTFKRVSALEWYTVNSGVLATSIYDLAESAANANADEKALAMYNSVYDKYSGNVWSTAISEYKLATGLN